jgi:hypothetical protein
VIKLTVSLILTLFLSGLFIVETGQFVQAAYNNHTMDKQSVIRSMPYPDPDQGDSGALFDLPNARCAHLTGGVVFAGLGTGPNMGRATVQGDACWNGTYVWPRGRLENRHEDCNVSLLIPTSSQQQWCDYSLDSPNNLPPPFSPAMTMGLNFLISPLADNRICEHGEIRIAIDRHGELFGWDGSYRQTHAWIVQGCGS